MADEMAKVIEELARVKNVGPARAEQIYKELQISTLDELIKAAAAHRLQSLSGIGEKTEASILQSAQRQVKEAQPQPQPEAASEVLTEQDLISAPDADHDVEILSEDEFFQEAPEELTAASAEVLASRGELEHIDAPVDEAKHEDVHVEEDAQVIADEPPVDEATDETSSAEEESAQLVDVAPLEPPTIPAVTAEARFLGSLICPNCGHDELVARGRALVCGACRREYDRVAGVTQLAPPTRTYDIGLAQRVMETQLYASLYEQVMRPHLTRLVTERTLPQEYILAAEYLDLSPGVRLLDVACGTGNFTRHFADALRELDAGAEPSLIVGLDMSEPMLDKAAEYLKASEMVDEIFLVRGDATRLPFRRGAFDRVHCAGALHMMEDPDEALRHFARVLRPDGLLVIGTFVEGSGLMRRALKRAAALPTHFRWFNPQDLRKRLERAGFEVQAQSKAQDALTLLARRV